MGDFYKLAETKFDRSVERAIQRENERAIREMRMETEQVKVRDLAAGDEIRYAGGRWRVVDVKRRKSGMTIILDRDGELKQIARRSDNVMTAYKKEM